MEQHTPQCHMGTRHPSPFLAGECNIGSIRHGCSYRLKKIAYTHPDPVARIQAIQALFDGEGEGEGSGLSETDYGLTPHSDDEREHGSS